MDLQQKIQHTKLFTDKEKIEILVKLGTYSAEAKIGLEKVIDDYDDSLKSISLKYKADMNSELDKIEEQSDDPETTMAATSKIRSGMDKIIIE